jgi:hypothetical protein
MKNNMLAMVLLRKTPISYRTSQCRAMGKYQGCAPMVEAWCFAPVITAFQTWYGKGVIVGKRL